MAYIRHRSRMVRQSVFDDAERVLTDTDWLGPTPLALLENPPISLIDYFPEDALQMGEKVAVNTLALDEGRPQELYEYELGGLLAQEYIFTFAFLAESDAVAQALFADLHDRYMGLSEPPYISLYNYLEATPTEVVRLEVDMFRYDKAPEQIAPGRELYLAEMTLTDYLDRN